MLASCGAHACFGYCVPLDDYVLRLFFIRSPHWCVGDLLCHVFLPLICFFLCRPLDTRWRRDQGVHRSA